MALADFKKPGTQQFTIEDAVFVVALPTRWNKQYTTAWQMALANESGEDFKIKTGASSVVSMMGAQQKAFAEHCILESPLSTEELLGDYVPLLDILHEKANELARIEEERADTLGKKLLITSSGTANGKDRSNSMKNSSVTDSLPAAT